MDSRKSSCGAGGFQHFTGADADGDVLERPAEAAHHVALEVGEDQHAVVVVQMLAHDVLVQVAAVVDRNFDFAELVHDVHRSDVFEAALFDGLPVVGHVLPGAAVSGAAFDDGAVQIMNQRPDQLRAQVVALGALAGGDFDADLAVEGLVQGLVHLDQLFRGDFPGEKYLACSHGTSLLSYVQEKE